MCAKMLQLTGIARVELSIIDNSSKHAYSLLENLLLWARTQTNKIDFQHEVYDLRISMQEVVELLEDQAKKKNISILPRIADRCLALADKNMMNTILRNLLTNAIKFTPHDGHVILSADNRQDHIEITVSDTGVGILREELPYLFRIDRKTTTLGTEKEKGSTFKFTIPI